MECSDTTDRAWARFAVGKERQSDTFQVVGFVVCFCSFYC